jgi:preprotein translocase subunit YajC
MMYSLSFILAQAKGPESIFGNNLIFPIVMVVMFYFLLIRPQQQQKKQLAARIASLESGDKVVTTSGIYGIIHNVKDKTVMIKVAEGTMIEFEKAAVATVQKK